ncbi:MAG: hypothetical protein ACKPKO_42270, partial [Candidatus Fonsibacter sp.]
RTAIAFPFIVGSGYGKQCFYMIQSMNLQTVMNGSANCAWRSARQTTNVRKTTTVVSYEKSQIIFQFITPRASAMLDPRNVVPYYELPVYKTTRFETLPSRPNWGQSNNNGVFSDAQAKHGISQAYN